MRLFICVAFLVGLVSCGDFMLESQSDMFGKWAKYKAMETCFGDEVTRNYILKLKKAHAKCMNVDLAPEAQLEMSQSSTKFIRALLDGSAQVERDTLAKLKDVLGGSPQQSSSSIQQQFGVPYPVLFPFSPFQQRQQSEGDEWMAEMRKFMMKKLFKKFADKKSVDKNVDESEKTGENDDDDDELAEKFFSKVLGGKKRNRRDEEEEGVTAQPELFGLGDRLNTKLTQEKAGLASKLSNYSCILQELKIVDKDNELSLDGFLAEVQNSGISDKWLLDTIVQDKKICYARAKALPQEVLESCTLGPKWVRIKEFMCCCKEAKMRTCMQYDTKQKLEANFGSVEKLRSQTGLSEKELLSMAMKIVFGSLDMD